MAILRDEIDANQRAFFDDWTAQAQKNWATLKGDVAFVLSYRRLVSMQALKTFIVLRRYSNGSILFFTEAHNDALVSHVNASIGAWRPALQALRSCIENVLNAIYYTDHPVELELWSAGKHRMTFAELIRYMEGHPRLAGLSARVTGIQYLKAEYGTLSKAVHGSAARFRMTDKAATVLLWSADPIKASMWSAREEKVLEAICLLLICLHRDQLQGASLASVRDVLGYCVSNSSRALLRKTVTVNVPAPA